MDINSPALIILVSTGIIFIIAGLFLYRWPPKEINMLYGYRSKRSMRNQETWNFAQSLGGKSMIGAGVLMIILGVTFSLFTIGHTSSVVIGISLLILIAMFMFLVTEKIIKQKFE